MKWLATHFLLFEIEPVILMLSLTFVATGHSPLSTKTQDKHQYCHASTMVGLSFLSYGFPLLSYDRMVVQDER